MSKGLGSGASPAFSTEPLNHQSLLTLTANQLMAVPIARQRGRGRGEEFSRISQPFPSPIPSGFHSPCPGIMPISQMRR